MCVSVANYKDENEKGRSDALSCLLAGSAASRARETEAARCDPHAHPCHFLKMDGSASGICVRCGGRVDVVNRCKVVKAAVRKLSDAELGMFY